MNRACWLWVSLWVISPAISVGNPNVSIWGSFLLPCSDSPEKTFTIAWPSQRAWPSQFGKMSRARGLGISRSRVCMFTQFFCSLQRCLVSLVQKLDIQSSVWVWRIREGMDEGCPAVSSTDFQPIIQLLVESSPLHPEIPDNNCWLFWRDQRGFSINLFAPAVLFFGCAGS